MLSFMEDKVYMEILPWWVPKWREGVQIKGFWDSQKQCNHWDTSGDFTLFLTHSQDDKLFIWLVYVDDTIISGDDLAERR